MAHWLSHKNWRPSFTLSLLSLYPRFLPRAYDGFTSQRQADLVIMLDHGVVRQGVLHA